MADDNDGESIEERVERLVSERLAADKTAAERANKLKGLGLTQDVLDVIADAVWDRGEARATARRKAEDDADQPPTTGARGTKKKGSFLGLFPVEEDTGTDG